MNIFDYVNKVVEGSFIKLINNNPSLSSYKSLSSFTFSAALFKRSVYENKLIFL